MGVTDETVVTVYKVTRPDCGTKQWCIYHSWGEVESEFDGAEDGDKIVVEKAAMTKSQLQNLPEFEGW